jgi:hypothetical protein
MKRSKFTDSQIMDALKRVDAGLAVPDFCRLLTISSATFYKWPAKYGGMDASTVIKQSPLDWVCTIFSLSETCCRYEAKHNAENEQIVNWLIRLTDNNHSCGFGLCYL